MPGKFRCQEDAFRHILVPVRIITAMACLKIKVPADHIGKFDRFCFGIPKFDETAFGTSIAQ
jgi:hypothetical protein